MTRKILSYLVAVTLVLPMAAGAASLTPSSVQQQFNSVPWTNGRGQLNGALVQQQLNLIPTLISGMGTWDPVTGIYTPNSGAALYAPTTSILGGIYAATAPTNQVMVGVGAAGSTSPGAPIFAQQGFGNLSGVLLSTQVPAFTGDFSCVGLTCTVGTNAIGYTKLSQSLPYTISGNQNGFTANRQDLTGAQATGLLTPCVGDTGLGGTKGLVPPANAGQGPGGAYLNAGCSFSVPPAAGPAGGSLTGNYPNPTVGPNQITYGMEAQAPATTLRGNPTGATANVSDNQLTAYMDSAFGATQGQIICRGASTWGAIGASTSGYVLTANGANVCPSYQASGGGGSAAPRSAVRQTVQGGPSTAGTSTTAASVPNFLAATSASLVPVFQNINTSTPLTYSAAQGSNGTGNQDLVYQLTANPTGPTLTGSQTVSSVSCTTTVCTITTSAAHNLVVGATVAPSGCSSAFLNVSTAAPYSSDSYFKVASVPSSTTFTVNTPNPQTGTAFASATPTGCSYTLQNYLFGNAQIGAISSSLLAPIQDQCGGAISTTSGQFTFDKCGGGTGGSGTNAGQPMVGYLAGVSTPLVALGECPAGASTLSGCFVYSYNGYAETIPITVAPAVSTFVSYNTNLGVGGVATYDFTFTTATNGYSFGDKATLVGFDGTYTQPLTVTSTKNTIGFTSGGANSIYYRIKTGALTAVAAGSPLSANFKMIHRRGWGGAYLLNRDLGHANDNTPVGLNAAA